MRSSVDSSRYRCVQDVSRGGIPLALLYYILIGHDIVLNVLFNDAVRFNTQRPVLLEKSPTWWKFPIDELHAALMTFNGTAMGGSSSITDAGSSGSVQVLAAVSPAYVVMYRPLCLAVLSSHFKEMAHKTAKQSSKSSLQGRIDEGWYAAFKFEVDHIQLAIDKIKWAMNTAGVFMVVVNYADLLWGSAVVVDALLSLLPCTSGDTFNSSFTPVVGRDIFFGNNFKTKGTVHAYGESHPPAHMSYNMSTGLCFSNAMLQASFVSASLRTNTTFLALQGRYLRLELELQQLAGTLNAHTSRLSHRHTAG